MTRHYSNVSKTMALQVAINSGATSVTVDDASGLPASYPFNVAIDYGAANVEIVSVTNVASNVLTVVRGQEDTAASSHSIGAVVVHPFTALDAQDAQDHIAASSNVHGVGGASSVAGTATAQTLTNKVISGSSNTLTNLPAGSVVGTFNNISVGQSNAAVPALTVTPNGAPATDVAQLGTDILIDADGQLRVSAGGNTFSQRWYGAAFVTPLAEMSSTGALSCVGVTSTGLINANAGVTVPSGQTLTVASGSTLTNAATGTHSGTNTFSGTANLNATASFGAAGTISQAAGNVATFAGTVNLNAIVSYGAASAVTFGNGYTVPSGKSGVFASGGTLSAQSGSNAILDGSITRDSVAARPLMDAEMTDVAGAFAASTSASLVDITGVTYTFAVPSGRTATLVVSGLLNLLGGGPSTTSYALAAVLDGSVVGTQIQGSMIGAVQMSIGKTWISEGLTAGSHTIKLQYRRTGGSDTPNVQVGTGQSVQVFW